VYYAAAIAVILFAIRLKRRRLPDKEDIRSVFRVSAFPVLIVLLWALRGMLLSGCPAYPSTLGCVSPTWAVPIESVNHMANVITN
jgi:hypothetical protein